MGLKISTVGTSSMSGHGIFEPFIFDQFDAPSPIFPLLLHQRFSYDLNDFTINEQEQIYYLGC